ncbi:hypothetical protein MOO44_00140 (plasmid) [Nicoliella spurrieriana]|uniref:Uncharacterized protein n=2 Tax=Nicoliella spurrieriana TaxID=2925830 RepID=A0A976RQQ3_9LACO|nr:hypothetical protein MOO44_00140 [Nicoliella spurrieriana]
MMALFILYPQVNAHAFIYGVDSAFHMNRFYDTAMQIKTGQYSYFQSFFGFQQSGRVVNAMYGPLFAYFNGILLLVAKTWYRYQLISSFLVLFISGSLMYCLAIRNNVKNYIGIILAVLYMLSDSVMAWIVGQQFTGWGAAFLPLAILMGTQMVRERKIQVVKLALAMTVLLQIHVMTSLMAALALVPFFIAALYLTTRRLQLFKQLGLAIGLTILLTANVWGGMLELSASNNLLPVAPGIDVSVTAPRIAGQSQAVLSSTASTGVGSGLNTLGISSSFLWIVIAITICLLVNFKRIPKLLWLITAVGVTFLWIASDYFPWHQLAHLVPSIDYIQFPSRFLVVGVVLLLLSFGMCLSQLNHFGLMSLLGGSCVLITLFLFGQTANQEIQNGVAAYRSPQVALPDRNLTIAAVKPAKLRAMFNDQDLSRVINAFNKPTPDYLPFFVKINPDQYWVYHPYHLYKSQILTNLEPKQQQKTMLPVTKRVVNNGLNITWTNPLNHKWWIGVPVIKYANTIVEMNGKPVKVDTSTIGKMFIDSKPGINHARVYYQPTWKFKLALLMMVFAWIGLGCYLFLKRIIIYLKKFKISQN